MREKLLVVVFLLVLPLPLMATSVHAQVTSTDITGGKSSITIGKGGVIYAFPIVISSPCLVWAIGVNWAGTGLGSVRVALYSNNYTALPYRPSSLLTDSGTDFVANSGGWQDIPVALRRVRYGYHWVAIQMSENEAVFAMAYPPFSLAYPKIYYYRGFGSFNSSWPDSNYTFGYEEQWNMRVVSLPSNTPDSLQQQNQINLLPISPRVGTCWKWS